MTTEEIIALKQEADKIMSIPGNTKGNSLYTDMVFVLEREGAESLNALEEALTLLGYPFSYKYVKGYAWYPESQAVLGIYLSEKLFGWTKKEIFEMGYAAPSTSLLVKTLMRFVSVESTYKQAPAVWDKHYDFGRLKLMDFDSDKKLLSFCLEAYGFFDYMKDYFDGFFSKTIQLVGIKSVDVFRSHWCDDSDHSCRMYEIKWI